MRKLLLLFTAVILVTPTLLFAQPVVGSVLPIKIDLGLKVAANFASINGAEWEKNTATGFAGGAFFAISRNRFGGQVEALFSRAKYTGNGVTFYKTMVADNNFNNAADSAKKGEFIVSSISLPVMLNVKIAGPLWFQVGPQFSSIISINDKDKLVKDTKDVFKTGDVSGVVGLQVNLASIRVSARYIFGFSDVSMASASSSWKQRNIQLGLGWSFL